MLKLHDIMATDVVTVSPETTLRDAMDILSAHNVGGAPVVSGEKLVGVVTSSDLMAFLATLPGVPTERPPEGEWAPWEEAPTLEAEVEKGDEGAAAFFSEMWDDAGADVTARMEAVRGPEWNVLDEHDVSEIMTRAPLATLPPNAGADAAGELMKQKKIHRVLVTEGDRLVGIVTALDLARAAGEHRLTTRVYAFNRDDLFRDREKE